MPVPGRIRVDAGKVRGNIAKVKKTGPQRITIASREASLLVIRTAKPRVPIGPGKGGHAASSLKLTGTGVTAGGPKYPYYPWLDFGGAVGPRKRTHRPWLKTGRFLYKAYEELKPRIRKIVEEQMVQAAQDAGLDVKR